MGTIDQPKISPERLKQLFDSNVPFNGVIDCGNGIVLIADYNIETYTNNSVSLLYYSKRIDLHVTKAIYTLKQGETIWGIAQRFGVTAEQIMLKNNIKDATKLPTGKVLTIDLDIKYGYKVESALDLTAFTASLDNNYKPMSESAILEFLDKTNTFVGSIAASLHKNTGKTRIGSNVNLYMEKSSGRVFSGNQYVKTYSLSNIGKTAGKVTFGAAIILEGVEITDGWFMDGEQFGHNTQKQLVGAAGSFAGALVGAKVGVSIGTAIGALFGGIGSIPGAMIGGFFGGLIGGFLGSGYGEDVAESGYDALRGLENKQQYIPLDR